MSIFRLFDGLDLCAPGDADSLTRAAAGLAPDAAVLDAGCGRGADLPVLLSLVPEGRVTAIDLSESSSPISAAASRRCGPRPAT
jgi:cyclopropane fatty-acyl-phospholipid synthase-like methyltransferase